MFRLIFNVQENNDSSSPSPSPFPAGRVQKHPNAKKSDSEFRRFHDQACPSESRDHGMISKKPCPVSEKATEVVLVSSNSMQTLIVFV